MPRDPSAGPGRWAQACTATDALVDETADLLRECIDGRVGQ